jgi:hypothetical protein
MNVKQTTKAIRELGLRATRFAGEWRIALPNNAEASAYYTEDNDDAFDTAKAMVAHQVARRK